MRWLIVFAFSLLSWNVGSAQAAFSAKRITASQIPSGIKFRGKIQEAWKWKDRLGENLLLLSVTDATAGPNEDEQTIQLFAYQYCRKDTGFRMLWRLNDLVKQCPVDITAEFIKGTTSITDLDGDSMAETTLIYKLACRGDVSPAEMKLIIHEDSVKYALRGSMWSPYAREDTLQSSPAVTEKDLNLETLQGYKGTEEEYFKLYGRYKTEKEFAKAPVSFLAFARRQWLLFAKESFE